MEMQRKEKWEQKQVVINELVQGQEYTKQLQLQLGLSASPELQELLTQKILSSFTNALSVLKYSNDSHQLGEPQPTSPMAFSDSPRSVSGSPPDSENSGQAFKDPELSDVNKKSEAWLTYNQIKIEWLAEQRRIRVKTLPKWIKQVRVCSGTGLEGQLDDGYNWRKYGQKDILGAKFSRAYYRCTHKSHGCPATKHVQRSDDDSAIFEVTYRGIHTCPQSSNPPPASTSTAHNQPDQGRSLLLNFRTGLKVETQNLDNPDPDPVSPPPFSFPPSMESIGIQSQVFSTSPAMEIPIIGSFSPTFISPATAESNYLPVSQGLRDRTGSSSGSELADVISGPPSATSSGLVGLEFTHYSLDQIEPTSFPFDSSFFFP